MRPQARFDVAPLAVTVRDATLDLARPLPVEIATTINDGTRRSGRGELVPETGDVQLELEVSGFELKALQPYANGTTDLTIRDGTIGAKGRTLGTPRYEWARTYLRG